MAEGDDLNTGEQRQAGFGTQTAAVSAFGKNPPSTFSAGMEIYDGSSWAVGPSGATARGYAAGCGTTS